MKYMTPQICTCGHDLTWHIFVKAPACDYDDCPCKKFEAVSIIDDIRKALNTKDEDGITMRERFEQMERNNEIILKSYKDLAQPRKEKMK